MHLDAMFVMCFVGLKVVFVINFDHVITFLLFSFSGF